MHWSRAFRVTLVSWWNEMTIARTGLALLCIISTGGCASTDPVEGESGRWNPIGANNANLAAEIANPDDLLRGRGVETADGQMAAAAVARLRKGHVKSLPDSDLSDIKVSGATGPMTTPVDTEGSP